MTVFGEHTQRAFEGCCLGIYHCTVCNMFVSTRLLHPSDQLTHANMFPLSSQENEAGYSDYEKVHGKQLEGLRKYHYLGT